jgi:hypothetical protein
VDENAREANPMKGTRPPDSRKREMRLDQRRPNFCGTGPSTVPSLDHKSGVRIAMQRSRRP